MGNGIQMGKIKKSASTIRHTFLKYLPPCFIVCITGCILIKKLTNTLSQFYYNMNAYQNNSMIGLNTFSSVLLSILSEMWIVLIPLWTIFCVIITGRIFYAKELDEPVSKLFEASEKISSDDLDFTLKSEKNNELGELCSAFDNMRKSLIHSNYEMWRSIEERKRLSAAFSHDLRTPLTVLRGYTEFMQKYGDTMSDEKRCEIVDKMYSQIIRLEKYTQKMNNVQKLEDITPNPQETDTEHFFTELEESGRILADSKEFSADFSIDSQSVNIDRDIFCEVYENLVSNASRYAKSKISAKISLKGSLLTLTVSDDGIGFVGDSAENAAKPFYRDDKDSSVHFGLGLYICSILCRKCGGNLTIGNSQPGGCVTASFSIDISPPIKHCQTFRQ